MNASVKVTATSATLVLILAVGLVADRSRQATAETTTNPTVTCNSSGPCLSEKNIGSGVGISGTGTMAAGVTGTTLFNSGRFPGKSGVFGSDASTKGQYSFGVFGESNRGTGVYGLSSTGIGVRATGNVGILALGTSGGGIAVNASGPFMGGNFVGGYAGVAANGNGGFGLVATSDATPAPPNSPSVAVLKAIGVSGGAPLMVATNVDVGDEMSLDVNGNMILAGGLTTFGTPLMIAHPVSTGSIIGTYTPQTTEPTSEDFGEAQLVDGHAYIRLDAAFESVTQRGMPYLVFLTPQGETKGLYVTQKTAAGFSVRENAGGRSTVTFDYRIVAMAAGTAHERLPQVRDTLYHGRTALPPMLEPNMRISRH